ncbi:MAG: DoxX family protein [Acidimicrobiales bacterium]
MEFHNAVNLGLLILRVSVGVTMIAHGYNHIWGGGKIAGTARWFESLGMKPGKLHAWLASLTELAAGVLLIVGFLTPLAAAGVVGTMLVAWITNHRTNGFFIFRPGEGYEYVMNLVAAGLALGAIGAGTWSIDRLVHSTRPFSYLFGWKGFAVTVIAGVGGAMVLLVLFWRPERKPEAAEEAT